MGHGKLPTLHQPFNDGLNVIDQRLCLPAQSITGDEFVDSGVNAETPALRDCLCNAGECQLRITEYHTCCLQLSEVLLQHLCPSLMSTHAVEVAPTAARTGAGWP